MSFSLKALLARLFGYEKEEKEKGEPTHSAQVATFKKR
jgi:hypothetical protein